LLNIKQKNMKKILLTSICFLSIGGVVLAQEVKQTSGLRKASKISQNKAADTKRVAAKEARAKNYSPATNSAAIPAKELMVDADPRAGQKSN